MSTAATTYKELVLISPAYDKGSYAAMRIFEKTGYSQRARVYSEADQFKRPHVT